MKTSFKELLIESSISRLWTHNEKHDCAAISAFRKFIRDEKGNEVPLSKNDNLKRNKLLLAKIQSAGYVATRVLGKYPEGGESKMEVSFFVVDIKDKGTLLQDLKKWGEYFYQDSVLFVPKGAISATIKKKKTDPEPNPGQKAPFLVATNNDETNWMAPIGTKKAFQLSKLGKESPIYTTYVNGRPFYMDKLDEGFTRSPGAGSGWMGMGLVSKSKWEDITLTESDIEYYGGE